MTRLSEYDVCSEDFTKKFITLFPSEPCVQSLRELTDSIPWIAGLVLTTGINYININIK